MIWFSFSNNDSEVDPNNDLMLRQAGLSSSFLPGGLNWGLRWCCKMFAFGHWRYQYHSHYYPQWGSTSCSSLQAGLWGFFQFMRIFVVPKGENEASHRRWKGCPQSSILNLQSLTLSPQSSEMPNNVFLLPKTWFTAFYLRMSRESQHTPFEDKIQEQVRLWGFPPTCASL